MRDSNLTLSPLRAPVTHFDGDTSRRLSRLFECRNRDCYRNAFRVLSMVPGASYVEGYAVSNDHVMLPVEHAWLETSDGVVIDPTPCYCAADRAVRTYVPTFRWSLAELLELLGSSTSAKLPFSSMLPSCGQDRVEWRDSTLLAWRYAAARYAEIGHRPWDCDEETALDALLGRFWTRPGELRGRTAQGSAIAAQQRDVA